MDSKNLTINIAHLYPKLLNIYGDWGNVLTVKKRCEWRNIDVNIDSINIGDAIDIKKYDFYFIGGGQDQQQRKAPWNFRKSRRSTCSSPGFRDFQRTNRYRLVAMQSADMQTLRVFAFML